VDNIQLIQLLDQIDKDTIPLASIDTNVVVPDTVPYNIYEENKSISLKRKKRSTLKISALSLPVMIFFFLPITIWNYSWNILTKTLNPESGLKGIPTMLVVNPLISDCPKKEPGNP
jgi:hypothetical protein